MDYYEIVNYHTPYCKTPSPKYYKSELFNIRLNKLLDHCVLNKNNECITARTILDRIGKSNLLFINGGAVRDILNGFHVKDIDLSFSIENKRGIEEICNDLQIDPLFIEENDTYNTIYCKFTDFIEGKTVIPLTIPMVENDVNALMYDYHSHVLIDPCGTGIINNSRMQFRIVQPTFDDLFKRNLKKGFYNKKGPVRIFKMLQKGYTMENYNGKNMETFRRWFKKNLESMKTEYPYPGGTSSIKVPILPWVLLKTIRQDSINEHTGKINKIGNNTTQLNEILLYIKNFDKEIYNDIIKNLSIYDNQIIEHEKSI
jgi:hypothetical protein